MTLGRSVYTDSFDLQWNLFRSTQLDSVLGFPRAASTLWKNTKWKPDELRGKLVLEAGCGPGKYTEILLSAGARVVSFDLTTAVKVNWEQNRIKGSLSCFQGDIYNAPLREQTFDYVFCYGVLQHCPDPDAAYRNLFRLLKPGGKISIDYYTNPDYPTPWTTPKYFWRRYTVGMNHKLLLWLLKIYIPLWLPIDTALRLVSPRLVGMLRVPCWNYLDVLKHYLKTTDPITAWRAWVQWAIMDTFDALSPAFDHPKSLTEVAAMVMSADNEDFEVFYGSNGIVANSIKANVQQARRRMSA